MSREEEKGHSEWGNQNSISKTDLKRSKGTITFLASYPGPFFQEKSGPGYKAITFLT